MTRTGQHHHPARAGSLACAVAATSLLAAACSNETPHPQGAAPAAQPAAPPAPLASPPQPFATPHWPAPGKPADPDSRDELRFLDAADDRERIEILGEIGASDPDALIPLLRHALLSGGQQLKFEALQATGQLEPAAAVGILSFAAADPSLQVATFAHEMSRDLPAPERLAAFRNSLASPHPEVRAMTASELGRLDSHDAVDLVIFALADPAAPVREAARSALDRRFAVSFGSQAEALAWWGARRGSFDERLRPRLPQP